MEKYSRGIVLRVILNDKKKYDKIGLMVLAFTKQESKET